MRVSANRAFYNRQYLLLPLDWLIRRRWIHSTCTYPDIINPISHCASSNLPSPSPEIQNLLATQHWLYIGLILSQPVNIAHSSNFKMDGIRSTHGHYHILFSAFMPCLWSRNSLSPLPLVRGKRRCG